MDTAKGIVFWEDMISTAIASFGGILSNLQRQYLQEGQQDSQAVAANHSHCSMVWLRTS